MIEQERPEAQPPAMEVVRGTATEEELAAVIAVLSATYAAEAASAIAPQPRVSVWQRTQRGLRTPLRREVPWGRFSG